MGASNFIFLQCVSLHFFPISSSAVGQKAFKPAAKGYYLNETDALLFTFNRQRCTH